MLNLQSNPLVQSLDRRFAGLIRFIPVLEQNEKLEGWHSNVVGAIPLRARVHYNCVKDSLHKSLELLAWPSRYLLELLVWALHVAKSKENARRLFEDQLIDAKGLLDSMEGLVKTLNANVEGNLRQLDKDRVVLKTKLTETSLKGDESFLKVGKLARELGLAGAFYGLNGFYSKLAHPTALSILLVPSDEQDEQFRTFMLGMALLCAKDILDIMGEFFRSAGTDTSLIEDPTYTTPETLRPAR